MKEKKQPTTFYIIRHGETEWNRQGLLQGQLNSPLSELGLNQAKALAEFFDSHDWDHIVCSDLGRALQTAEIIKDSSNKELITDPRLRERNLGIAQGLTTEGFSKKYPEEFEKFKGGSPDVAIKGGESMRERFVRCIRCIEECCEKYCGQKVIIVTHGGVLDSVFRHITRIPLNQPRTFSLFNASVNTVEVKEGAWSIVSWGHIEHLRALGFMDDWYRGAI